MIIIWRGLGILVPFIVGGFLLLSKVTVGVLSGDELYFSTHGWPKFVACLLAAGVVFLIARARHREDSGRDTLFFIPMEIWSMFVMIGGVFCLIYDPQTEPLAATDDRTTMNAASAPAGTPVYAKPQPASHSTPVAARRELKLQAIFYNSNGHSTAMISQKTVSVGDQVGAYTVTAIEQDSVALRTSTSNKLVLKPGGTW